jgi:3-deoxy-D-manno-octulosonic-acid transferase
MTGKLMRKLYNILFFIFFWLSAPFYFLKLWRRGNWQKGFWQRFGRHTGSLKYVLTNRHVIWVHAVSVGEVGVCAQLIQALEPRLPLAKFVVSTTTTTGMGELEKKLPAHVEKIYYPVDFPGSVQKAITAVHPEAVILVEAEIWPNFLWQLKEWKLPVFLVNARLSERSYPRYCKLAFLFQPLFGGFVSVGAQKDHDVTRLKMVGCRAEAIHLTGNLKFDAVNWKSKQALDVSALLRQLGVEPNARILVAGSTHDGEEIMLAQQFQRLRKHFPDLFLVIVPRHMERAKAIAAELRRTGLKFVLRRELTATSQYKPGEVECLVVNTTGELMYFYECATVVFVGKSITAKGGQNPIEPALLGKPVVFGPNMQNFRSIVEAFVEGRGVMQVRNAAELEKVFASLLSDEKQRTELGRNARAIVEKNQGAVDRTVEMLLRHLTVE